MDPSWERRLRHVPFYANGSLTENYDGNKSDTHGKRVDATHCSILDSGDGHIAWTRTFNNSGNLERSGGGVWKADDDTNP